MRIVLRAYRDGFTKPHHDEYKTDCYDEETLETAIEDIGYFLSTALEEIEEGEEDDSSNKSTSIQNTD